MAKAVAPEPGENTHSLNCGSTTYLHIVYLQCCKYTVSDKYADNTASSSSVSVTGRSRSRRRRSSASPAYHD